MNKFKNILVLLSKMEILVSVTGFRSLGFILDRKAGIYVAKYKKGEQNSIQNPQMRTINITFTDHY